MTRWQLLRFRLWWRWLRLRWQVFTFLGIKLKPRRPPSPAELYAMHSKLGHPNAFTGPEMRFSKRYGKVSPLR